SRPRQTSAGHCHGVGDQKIAWADLFPQNTAGTKLDIVDDTSRKAAMSAIHDDLRSALATRVADATNATTLPPIQALLPDLFELTALETVLTGDNKNSKQYFTVLGVRARE